MEERYEKEMETSDSLTSGMANLEEQEESNELIEALKEMDAEEARFVDLSEDSSVYVLVYKRDINKTVDTYLEEDTNRLTILDELRGEEFADMMEEKVDSLSGVEINEAALNDYKASMYYTFKEPASSAGSSSAASSSASSSEASSEESSSEATESE